VTVRGVPTLIANRSTANERTGAIALPGSPGSAGARDVPMRGTLVGIEDDRFATRSAIRAIICAGGGLGRFGRLNFLYLPSFRYVLHTLLDTLLTDAVRIVYAAKVGGMSAKGAFDGGRFDHMIRIPDALKIVKQTQTGRSPGCRRGTQRSGEARPQ
jgi:hypothetical protein